MIRLGVNIDHVATVRQARRTVEPDPVQAAILAQLGGADSITVHLREDRRHIQDRDVRVLLQTLQIPMNLEMAVCDEIVEIACELRPHDVCLVPEKRQEITTEGGLAVSADDTVLAKTIERLHEAGIRVSLFIDPDVAAVRASKALHADAVELHTGAWAEAFLTAHKGPRGSEVLLAKQFERLLAASHEAGAQGIELHAGHGITYHNVHLLRGLPLLTELNIGHTIISRAVLVGIERAVRDMRQAIG